MNISEQGIKLIQHFESCKKADGKGGYVAYQDPKGIWTVGWGSIRINGRKVKQGDRITQVEADQMMVDELKWMVSCVNKLLKTTVVTQAQFDVLVSFAYNVGPDMDGDGIAEGLGDSTLLKKVKANPNDPAIKDEFVKWRNKGSDFEKGILRRRLAEAHLYFKNELVFEHPEEIKKIMGK